MGKIDDEVVWIRRQWNDWRDASVRLSDIERPHWSSTSGGVMEPAPRSFIHAYVWCDRIEGYIGHSCCHGPPPHRIKVCIIKRTNTPAVFKKILSMVEAGKTKT